MAADPNLIGINIADRYCITGKIGAGGMGQVYSAISYEDPSRTVAIKLIQRDKALSSEDLLRFQKEAALMSQLHHPNIICFYELGLFGNENIDGRNLQCTDRRRLEVLTQAIFLSLPPKFRFGGC